jgi:hypothetical protein
VQRASNLTAKTEKTTDDASTTEEAKNDDLVFDRKLDLATAGLYLLCP